MYVATRNIMNLALGLSWRKGQAVSPAALPPNLFLAMLAEGVVVERLPTPEPVEVVPEPADLGPVEGIEEPAELPEAGRSRARRSRKAKEDDIEAERDRPEL